MRGEQLEDIDADAPEENELGHLLKTVNPQAAAAIDNPPESPDVGTWVVFKGRAGFSRMHRTEFPALVLGEHRDGGLILMVVMEPEDMMMEDRVPFRSHNQDQFYWRYRRISEAEIESDNHRANNVASRVSLIEAQLEGEDNLFKSVDSMAARVALIEAVLASDEIEVLEKRLAECQDQIARIISASAKGSMIGEVAAKKKPGRKPKAK